MSDKPTKEEIIANIAWIYNGNHYESREFVGIAVDGYFTTYNMIGEVIEPIDYHSNVQMDFWQTEKDFIKQFERDYKKFWAKYFYEHEAYRIAGSFNSMYKSSVFRSTYGVYGMFKKILNMGFEPYDIFSEACHTNNHHNYIHDKPRQRYIGMLKHCKTGQFIGCGVPAYMFLNELYEKYYFHLKAQPKGFISNMPQFGFQSALDVNGIDYSPNNLPILEAKPILETKSVIEVKTKAKKVHQEYQPDFFGEVA